jgi:ubiquinone/menaquinone biosynthesis C-methylase UbiE
MKEKSEQSWSVLLFNKSVLKQRKFKEITELLGETSDLRCLDLGADNGVISYLLRERGGSWKSADLDEQAVCLIRQLVKEDVFQINGISTTFNDNEFDRVVIVDLLEHIETEREFIDELFRIIKPGGELIINVPHIKNSLLRKVRLAIGQTDEKHGHLRPGYTVEQLAVLLKDKFQIVNHKSYSKFFSEFIDTLINFGLSLVKKGENSSKKEILVTEKDISKYQKMFKVYSVIYPVFWVWSKLDTLLFWRSGYMLIVKAKINKQPINPNEHQITTSTTLAR